MSGYDEILCHCGSDNYGHTPGVGGCAEQAIKRGVYPSRSGTGGLSESWSPGQPGDIYSALTAAAKTPAERKQWRDHARMLREAHTALRRRPVRMRGAA